MHCANCGSPSGEWEFDLWFCLTCGRKTDTHGALMPPQPEFRVPTFQEAVKAAGGIHG